jgi:hypothetical protein
MATKLNKSAFEHARKLIRRHEVVHDERDAWSEHQPSTAVENAFIRRHGFDAYSAWHLGVDTTKPEQTKGRYKYPYGDFKRVHRCAVISAESRAGQYKHLDVENAASRLLEMMDSIKPKPRGKARDARRKMAHHR